MKFLLMAEWTKEEHQPAAKVTHEFEADTLDDVMDWIEAFLAGCTFQVQGQHLELVDDNNEKRAM